ncbi:S8 family serine peptidase [Umezawaea sp.]|uniref:S8 family serine peptidase n=1 Tax=Umezawaea sp. TaxID=1955258 RepID=UPI002ED05C5C
MDRVVGFGGLVVAGVVALAVVQVAAASADPVGDKGLVLLTGDRVVVGDGGAVSAVEPGPGREALVFSTYERAGHRYVVPEDALAPIRGGRLDERIFDVTALRDAGYGTDGRPVPLIVSHPPGSPRTADLAAIGASTVEAAADGSAWRELLEGGARKVWLDGRVTASLDRSTRQIGAPAAWEAGHTGEGVVVAVLDTGVDQTHPDLAGQEVAERNFSTAADTVDRYGHGTHVAATIASRGAGYRGVAPGARLLDGKVLDDSGGGSESDVLRGMQWAAEQGARVVNMSLGTADSDTLDPVEDAVNTLSARYGTLFVVAAGNSGPDATTVGSPGSADAALTVGAVDRDDAPAPFSSRGPRVGDGAIKPDITAPGVGIVAAKAIHGRIGTPVDPGHVSASGTSMATPHVAGAAAVLAGQHPDWTGERLKSALTASARPTPGLTPFEQGAGRVDVARAITQEVGTVPSSVSLGTHVHPHDDDQPVTKSISYRNSGTADVVLDLAVEAAAPAGMFTLTPARLTVPAGGGATASVTGFTGVDTADGTYHGAVVATGGGTTARTPIVIVREAESYDLTLNHVQRPGAPSGNYSTTVRNLATGEEVRPHEPDGSVTVRLPKGRYLVDSTAGGPTFDWLVQPFLVLDRDTAVELDFRTAQPIRITAPDPVAFVRGAAVFHDHRLGTGAVVAKGSLSGGDASLNRMRVAHVGPPAPADEAFRTLISTQWAGEGDDFYGLAYHGTGTWPTGFTRAPAKADLAHVRAEVASGRRLVKPYPRTGAAVADHGLALPVSGPRDEYLSTESSAWRIDGRDLAEDGSTTAFEWRGPVREHRPGRTSVQRPGGGVLGPAFPPTRDAGRWVSRTGDVLHVDVPLFGDREGNAGFSAVDPRTTVVHRDGREVAKTSGTGAADLTLPAEPGTYRLSTSATHAGSAVSAAWTFRSGRTDRTTPLPLSAVRFDPDPADAVAGRTVTVPVSVTSQTGVAPRSLTVRVSYDSGRTWRPAPLLGRALVVLHHPRTATSVSLRATAVDRDGGTVEQTILDAYRLG